LTFDWYDLQEDGHTGRKQLTRSHRHHDIRNDTDDIIADSHHGVLSFDDPNA
jgi:hypothetical protein